jgi:AcrR family transcriptional regulator
VSVARKYELKQRAEQAADTRQRIVETVVGMHLTVGPAATTISEVARRAGVQRQTVYNHFPEEQQLFAACSAHWRALHPAPDPAAWTDLRDGLRELYAWYRETEPMTANVLRDAAVLPALRAVLEPGLETYLSGVRRTLAKPLGRSRRVAAAVAVAADFHVWSSLKELGDADAADLMATLVEEAARSPRRGSSARPAR